MKKPFLKSKKVKPKKIGVGEEKLVTTRFLDEGATLPLVVEPKVSDLDHLAWLAEESDWVEKMLYRHGAILFRGFTVDKPREFEAFASILTSGLYGNYGDLPPAEGKVYGVTPYPPEGTILFHNESSHMHQWPMKQFFYCDIPASKGGETPIADCRAIYKALDPKLIALLENKKLRYVRNFIKGVDVSWQDFFKTEDRAEVEARCAREGMVYSWKGEDELMTYQIAPAVIRHPVTKESVFFNQIMLHHASCLDGELGEAMSRMYALEDMPRNVFLGDGEVLDDAIVKEIVAQYWSLSKQFTWQHGDILMVDNMLVSHARNPYEPPRKMYVAMGNIIKSNELAKV